MTDAISYWTYSPQLAAQQYAQQQQLKQREAERAAERERAKQIRQEEVLMRFGDDAVVGPDGDIDILRSTQKRALSDEAERVGRLEGVMQASIPDVNPELRSLPAFRRGMAAGMAERQLQDFNLDRQLAVEAARERARLGVAERQAESREHLANLARWDDITRAFGNGPRVAPEDLVEIVTGGGKTGQPRVTQKVPRSQLAEMQAQQQADKAVADIDRSLADYEDAERRVRLSSAGDFVLSFDADGKPTVKEGGLTVFGDEPRKNVLARIEAERNALLKKRAALTERTAKRPEPGEGVSKAAERYLQGLGLEQSVKPTAAPSVGGVPMGDRQADAVARDAVNRQPSAGPQYFYDAKTGRVVLMQPRQQ